MILLCLEKIIHNVKNNEYIVSINVLVIFCGLSRMTIIFRGLIDGF